MFIEMILQLFKYILSFCSVMIILYIVMDILLQKNILKKEDKTINDIFNILTKIVKPILDYIKKFMPNVKNINLILLIFLLILDLLIKFI